MHCGGALSMCPRPLRRSARRRVRLSALHVGEFDVPTSGLRVRGVVGRVSRCDEGLCVDERRVRDGRVFAGQLYRCVRYAWSKRLPVARLETGLPPGASARIRAVLDLRAK